MEVLIGILMIIGAYLVSGVIVMIGYKSGVIRGLGPVPELKRPNK